MPLLLLLLLVSVGACANGTERTRVGSLDVVTLRLDYNNIHAVRTSQGTYLVDAGLARDAQALVQELRAHGVRDIRGVVLTHGHADHAGGAAHLRATYGAKVYASAAEAGMLHQGHNDALCPTDATARDRLEAAQRETYAPLQADVWLKPEDTGGLPGSLLFVPGHTPGSIVWVVGGAAFVGDLFRGAIVGSSAETHFFQCDQKGVLRDIRRLLREHPDVKIYFTGHFGPVSRAEVEAYLTRQGA